MPLNETAISWTDYTWNWVHGCAKTSEGCRNCWAENVSHWSEQTELPWTVAHLDDNLMLRPDALFDLDDGLIEGSWVFSPSVSDPFLEPIPDAFVRAAITAMERQPASCFQMLTKHGPDRSVDAPQLPENVMLGVTVESERRTYRLDWLREQDAEMKFVSFEPLVERISDPDLSGIDWAIIGGESGENRREMNADWARDLYTACREQDVAFHFKQHSDYHPEHRIKFRPPGEDAQRLVREFPETPTGVVDEPMSTDEWREEDDA